ncbi:MAG TPA: hypothetical protein VGF99_19790 [Myxococcota bacterium]
MAWRRAPLLTVEVAADGTSTTFASPLTFAALTVDPYGERLDGDDPPLFTWLPTRPERRTTN